MFYEKVSYTDEEEAEKEKSNGDWQNSGKYAGVYFENVLCESEYYKEDMQLCYSLVDMSGEGICELLIGVRNAEGTDNDGLLPAVFTCQITGITVWRLMPHGRRWWIHSDTWAFGFRK